MFSVFMTTICTGSVYAAHPLITDDAGTQGKGKYQFEFNGEYFFDKENVTDPNTLKTGTQKQTGGQTAASFTAGAAENVDLILGFPYLFNRVTENDVVTEKNNGFSDMTFEVKWRFYEKDGLSFALKPGLRLPIGNEDKGLGDGRLGYGITFISTKEIDRWAFHLNLGYSRHNFKLESDGVANRSDIWGASLASEYKTRKNLKFVANIGLERNIDATSSTPPAFLLGGVIYSLRDNFDLDCGLKYGLTKPENDLTGLAGITWRF